MPCASRSSRLRRSCPAWPTAWCQRLGFDNLVNKTYEQQIQTNLTNAENDQALWQTTPTGTKTFGTPTVVTDTRLRQTSPQIETHRDYIADMLTAGVTPATIWQRRHDEQDLVASLRR